MASRSDVQVLSRAVQILTSVRWLLRDARLYNAPSMKDPLGGGRMTESRSALEVLNHHDEAMVAKDIDSVLSDFAEDAVILGPDGPIKGKEAIREFFAGFAQLLTPEFIAAFEITRQGAAGDVAYQTWKSGTAVPLGTDTLVVRDGLITTMTFAAYMPS
ncbi:MAG: Ketosteroid isomerase-like protein [Chloroflexi bacterium]|nr:MAG: Ketosteroid isomerase-like protein [Chloroflexota bacterium]